MKKSVIILLSILVAGCASTIEPLHLDNVMSARAAKQSTQAPAVENAVPAPEPQGASDQNDQMAVSSYDPPELYFLRLPQEFLSFTEIDADDPRVTDVLPLVPGARYVAEGNETDLVLIAGVMPIDQSRLKIMSRDDFVGELRSVTEKWDQYYQTYHHARAVNSLDDRERHFYVRLESKYLRKGIWWTDVRWILFYRDEYHMTLLLSGPDEEVNALRDDVRTAVSIFKNILTDYFRNGLSLKNQD